MDPWHEGKWCIERTLTPHWNLNTAFRASDILRYAPMENGSVSMQVGTHESEMRSGLAQMRAYLERERILP